MLEPRCKVPEFLSELPAGPEEAALHGADRYVEGIRGPI
jgi:hypothetical protein